MRFTYRPAVEKDIAAMPGVKAELRKRGEKIATETRTNARMARRGRRYEPIDVTDTKDGVRVAAHGPFAHLDEWGSINNAPTAAMRRAANHAGRFNET